LSRLQTEYQATYNIYNFDAEDPSYNRFDVSACYAKDKKKPFMMKFQGMILIEQMCNLL